MKLDYYQVLELSTDASEEDILRAYKRAALKCILPEKHWSKFRPNQTQFEHVSEAYQILGNPRWRSVYDRCRLKETENSKAETSESDEPTEQMKALQNVQWDWEANVFDELELDSNGETCCLQETVLGRNILVVDVGFRRVRCHSANLLSLQDPRRVFEEAVVLGLNPASCPDERALCDQLLRLHTRIARGITINVDVFGNKTELCTLKEDSGLKTIAITRNDKLLDTVSIPRDKSNESSETTEGSQNGSVDLSEFSQSVNEDQNDAAAIERAVDSKQPAPKIRASVWRRIFRRKSRRKKRAAREEAAADESNEKK